MVIKGLDDLSRTLDQAQKALEELDGELGSVSFDPDDPASIERAVIAVETMVDQKLQPYAGNSIIAPLIASMKEQYRNAIVERAQEARLAAGDSPNNDDSHDES